MPTYVFPSAAALKLIEQEVLPRLTADDDLFDILPVEVEDEFLIMWEQRDNYIGLQQVRGLDGAFSRVKKVALRRYQLEPGVYGEFVPFSETELTRQRVPGSFGDVIDVRRLVMGAQDQLLSRRLDRVRYIGWTLLATGTFSVANDLGSVVHTDTYTTQTSTPGITWATVATAVPLTNFRTAQLLGPAHGADFGGRATAYMNRTTFNSLMANTNAADLGGRFSVLFNAVRSIESINRIQAGEDLPAIRVVDEGYFNDSGTFTRFIPNNKVIIVGKRRGSQRIGSYKMVRNANNPGAAPGPYTEVIQRVEPPKTVSVYDGHSGGVALEYPGSVLIMTV